MRFRTKMFLGWVALTLALWFGASLAIRRSVQHSFNHTADQMFAGIHRGLRHLYIERVSSMGQACELVVNIPELRALIAEQNYELDAENQASLRERLDYVSQVVGATFVCALSDAGAPVAQNATSPWPTLGVLREHLQHSRPGRALVERTFAQGDKAQYGLWVYRGALYQVAAVPLVFQSDAGDEGVRPDGALVMGKRLTDGFSSELGRSYGCDITFLAAGRVAASSLPAALRPELIERYGQYSQPRDAAMRLGDTFYRAAFEPLIDPCSSDKVGTVVVQQDRAHAEEFLWNVERNLIVTVLGGVIAAAAASFLLSLAITRPVQALVSGVRRIARGDLDVTFNVSGRDELAELAEAFNDMVGRLRQSRSEQDRLLDEARRAAQREHLLHEVAQQINQRLDVQSSLAMFLNSVQDLLPDMQLTVFHYDSDQGRFRALDQALDGEAGGAAAPTSRPQPLDDAHVTERLARHELVYLPRVAPAGVDPCSRSGSRETSASQLDRLIDGVDSLCLVPMRAAERLLGAIVATRAWPDAFDSDEREFLQALADHFAIALANAQVYEELRRAYQDLRANQRQIIQTERLRALGQMASGIAHDFNNHLTGVLAFLEMSLDRDDLDAELRSWLEMSRESSLAAAEVVTLLRNFYRRDASETLEPVDLNKLVSVTISLTRPRWFDMPRRHGLVINVCEELGEVDCVLGNASELRDALTNLLFNAVDAMTEGGDITVRTRPLGDEIALEVQDTGAGMSEEVREQCLEPYFTTKGTQGTGLGLSMVVGIAQRHRGRLEIDSCPGRDTTMRLVFPRAQLAPVATTAAESSRLHGPKRILCVDDDRRVLKSLEGMLRQLGHDVTSTASGAEAIQRVGSERFDVLITDLGMPGVDGREVARAAKRVAPHTRVLLLTGWADRLTVEGDVPEGVDQLLGKPITKAQLQQAVSYGDTSNAKTTLTAADSPSLATTH